MISNSTKLKLHKWIILTVGWMIIGLFLAIYTHLITKTGYYTVNGNYSFPLSLILGVTGGLFGGLIGGCVMVFVFDDMLKKQAFITKVIFYVVIVVIVIMIVNIILAAFYLGFSDDPDLAGKSFGRNILNSLLTYGHLQSQVTWLSVVLLTTFIMNVSDTYGPGRFLELILGKYHRPFAEQRIFMFLDIRSSTAIAERLGHQKYFEFLQDFYADITDPVIDSKGRIYQYVGDEVVITWDMQSGLKNSNCLKCFFKIRNTIEQLGEKYIKKYDVLPDFKAGIHYGMVTTGEVGILKKEIIHTGDVLNTTARIENKCNWLGVNFIASGDLINLISDNGMFMYDEMGKIDLRGKMEMVELVAIFERLKIERKLDSLSAGAV